MLNTKIENPVACEVRSVMGFKKLKMIVRRKYEEDGLLKSVSEGSMNEGNVGETMSAVERREKNA